MTEPTSTWPKVRIDPSIQDRLQKALNQAGDATPFLKIVNSILAEAAEQIESEEDSLPTLRTIHRLRHSLGRYSGEEFNADLKGMMQQILRRQEEQQKQIDSLSGKKGRPSQPTLFYDLEESSARVAEDPPKPRPRPKK